jgi:hypothetical protein
MNKHLCSFEHTKYSVDQLKYIENQEIKKIQQKEIQEEK